MDIARPPMSPQIDRFSVASRTGKPAQPVIARPSTWNASGPGQRPPRPASRPLKGQELIRVVPFVQEGDQMADIRQLCDVS